MLYLSSRQTIAAYPTGGSSYTVARENLGIRFGLVAAAALFLDYVLNAAVAISAGVAALRFAMRMSPNVVAMHVSLEEEETAGRRRQWTEFVETPARRSSLRRRLEIVPFTHRHLVGPLLKAVLPLRGGSRTIVINVHWHLSEEVDEKDWSEHSVMEARTA